MEMKVPGFTPYQHAQILGYGIIAYGIASLIDLAGVIQTFFMVGTGTSTSTVTGIVFWPKIVFGAGFAILCFLAGAVIKNRDVDPKGYGLAVAMVSIGSFPLGTIISAYTLFYLFVVWPNEGPEPDRQ